MTPTAAPEKLEKHYSAEDDNVGILQSLLPIVGYPRELWLHRYLVQNFFRRELLGRFRGSMLGIFWVLVHPMFLFTIYYFVFGYMFGNLKTGQSPDPHYAIYLFSGVLVFTALSEGCTRSCTVVIDNGNLVKKVAFPSQILPVHTILIALMVYLVGATVCFSFGTAFGVLQPGWHLLLLPVVLLVQFVMTLGIGLLLANLQVFARDISQMWSIAATAWMFLTPVFWYPYQLTEHAGGWVATMLTWNPAYPLMQAQRIALGAVDFAVPGPDGPVTISFGNFWEHTGVACLWACAFLAIGYSVFMSNRHKFADLI